MYRADIGFRVREKLAATSGVRKASLNDVDMFVLRDFLGKEKCEALIQMIERDRKPSQLLSSNNPDANFRTSETCLLHSGNQVVQGVESELTALLEIEPQHGEALRASDTPLVSSSSPTMIIFEPPRPIGPNRRR